MNCTNFTISAILLTKLLIRVESENHPIQRTSQFDVSIFLLNLLAE